MDKWISTKDRLPKIWQDVLIYYPQWTDAPIQVAHLDHHGMTFDICGEFNVGIADVSWWMPLPDPPKEQ